MEVSIVAEAGEGLVADLGEDSLPPVPELITGQDYNVEVNHCDSVHQVRCHMLDAFKTIYIFIIF